MFDVTQAFADMEFNAGIGKIKTEFEAMKSRNKMLQDKISELESDKGVKTLQEMIQDLCDHSLYMMNDEELKFITQFKESHRLSCKNSSGFSYGIASDGLVSSLAIQCPVCGQSGVCPVHI